MAKNVPLEDQTQSTHTLSESEGETSETPRLSKTKPRKSKMAAADARPKTRGVKAADLPTTETSNSSKEEFSDFKRMYAEMIVMREEAKTFRESAEQFRATSQDEQGRMMEGATGVSQEGWQENMEEQDWYEDQGMEEDEESESSDSVYNTGDHLEALRFGFASTTLNEHVESKTIDTQQQKALTVLSPFSGFRAPPRPKPLPVEAAAAAAGGPTTIGKSGALAAPVTAKPRRVFTLAAGLQEGKLLTELQEVYKKVKKPVAPKILISESMAGVISHYYSEIKHLKIIKDISRQYTGLADIDAAQVQLLNEEIRFTDTRKEGENSLLTASKGLVGVLTAIAPLMDIILQRGNADPELNEHAGHMLNAIRMLVATHSQIRLDRIASVKKVVHTTLGKELIQQKKDVYGEKPMLTEHLLGENLGDRNKQLLKSMRASDSCMQTSLAYRGKRRQQQERMRQTTPYNKFRGFPRFRGGRGRGSTHTTWGAKPQPTERRFGRTTEDYGQHGNTPNFTRGGRGKQTQSQGFQK